MKKILTAPRYLSDILYHNFIANPEKVAVIYDENYVSYKELFIMSKNFAKSLSNYNPKTIGIVLPRSLDYLLAYFSATFLGAIIVPIDSESTVEEIVRTADYCNIDLLIVRNKIDHNFTQNNKLNTYVMPQNIESLKNLDNAITYGVYENAYNDENDTVLLLHTSGSIDLPKRVMLSHRNIIENATAHFQHMQLKHDDNVLITLPMHFGYCNTAQIISHLLLGGTLVIMDGIFSPHKLLASIERYGISVFTAVPTMLHQLLDFKHSDKYDLSTLHQVTYGGAPFSAQKIKLLRDKFPNIKFCQTYGLTEAGPRLTAINPQKYNKDDFSVGTPIPNVQLKIIDEEGNELNTNEVGEIIARSPGVMKGYYNRPEETSKVIINDWLFTGDLGYFNSEGDLHIVGRRKNIIIRGGVNIYPEELENYLSTHPAIKETLVYGIPHEGLSEKPHALVVLHFEIPEKEILEFCKKGLSKYKIPTIEIVEKLEKTYNNKIKRVIKDSVR